jgi:8-oxo-dGTP diphosphatase
MNQHSVSVAGVTIDDQGRILIMQRRDNGHWEAPGGVLDLLKTPEDGAAREVLEETGVHVRVERLTGVYKNMTKGVIALVYRCSPRDGDAAPSREASDVRWARRDEIDDFMTPAYAVRVHDAFGDVAASRQHDGVNLLPGTIVHR